MKAITVIVLIAFLSTAIGFVPASADGVAYAGDRKDRPKPPPDTEDGKREDRPRPPPRDNDSGTRPPRERGQPPVYDQDDHIVPPLPDRPICHCGRVYCDIHVYDYYPGEIAPRSGVRTSVMVGIYGMAAATVMGLNLAHTTDGRSEAGLGAAGIGLGWTGIVWSYGEDDPQNQRTLFLSGLFSIAFALIQYAGD